MTACHASTSISSGAFRFYFTTTPSQYLISPELKASSKSVKVEFDYYAGLSSQPESFQVGYSTTTNDVAAFSWGEEKTTNNTNSYNPDHYSDVLPAGVKYIAIQCSSDDKYALYIDNFSAEEYGSATCFTPVNLAAAVKPDGAVINWSAANGERQFQYKVGEGDWTLLDEDVLNLTISGLASGTERTVSVRAYCSADDQSAAASVKFTALCPAPTALSVSNVGMTSATLSWTKAEGISKYQYVVLPKGATEDWSGAKEVAAETASLSELTAGQAYDVYVRSWYSDVSQSASAKVSFKTKFAPIATLPWNENFEGLTELPDGWETAGPGAASISVSKGLSYGLELESDGVFFSGDGATYAYVILPEFEAALSTLEIVFSHIEEIDDIAKCGNIELGYYKDDAFTLLKAYDLKTAMTNEAAFALTSVPAGARIAFAYKANTNNWAAAVDNIIVRIIGSTTGIESIQNSEFLSQGNDYFRIQKTIVNGQLIIIREGEKYNAQGAKVN
jgi:hypothetical protein